ncbi:MAG TPA: glycosyltransferase family 4 protein [Pyrinomonadaceae bacterium]|nr:glycosyltransferase family 4 protein [Pyrinomonadaceae bacterium]
MKILWLSDSPTSPSGFGNITRFVCAGLAGKGHQVAILGCETPRLTRRRHYTIYPFVSEASGTDLLLPYLDQLRPDVLVTAADPWRVSYIADPAITDFMRERKIVWALYYPIDSDWGRGSLPPTLIQLLRIVDLPIVMSHYGRDLSQINGVTAAYIPPGVDTKAFSRPSNKTSAKKALGYGGRFVVLSDARNQRRKLWPRTLEVFRRFAKGKDDVLFHLHCDPYDPAASSDDYCYDLLSDIEFLGLGNKVRFTRGMSITQGTSLARLAALYRAADIHLLASYGEGFGLPTLQAAAAAVVPMAAAYSANRELVEGHGEALRIKGFVRNESNMRCALIDIDEAVGKLDRLYKDRRLLEMKSKAARRFAESYDWQHVLAKWHDLLVREVPCRRDVSNRSKSRDPLVRLKTSEALPQRGKELSWKGSLFTIPVTLPPVTPKRNPSRITGRVYLATAADRPVFTRLKRIFPGLSAWSTGTLGRETKSSKGPQPAVVHQGGSEFATFLATSTLALDLASADPTLPREAAKLGVPLVGVAHYSDQQSLWPRLTLKTPDKRKAAEIGRWMLTDQYDAIAVCAWARKRVRAKARKAATN